MNRDYIKVGDTVFNPFGEKGVVLHVHPLGQFVPGEVHYVVRNEDFNFGLIEIWSDDDVSRYDDDDDLSFPAFND